MLLATRRLYRQLGARLCATTPHPSVLFRDPKTINTRPACTITTLLEKNGLYVDQTEFLEELLTEGGIKMQVAVPRRFSKSTNLNLIDDACQKNAKERFEGTYLGRSDFFGTKWMPPYSVVRLDFSDLADKTPAELEKRLLDKVNVQFANFGITTMSEGFASGKLEQLLHNLKKQGQCAVVLVDEYDVPALSGDPRVLRTLHDFFSPLKNDVMIKKLIMFGTHKVLQQIGTAMNDTPDLLRQRPYYNMFGFSAKHVEDIFSERDPSFLKYTYPDFQTKVEFEKEPAKYNEEKRVWILGKLKEQYDGYRFSGHPDAQLLYNPYSVLMFRKNLGEFGVYSPLELRKGEEMPNTLRKYPELLEKVVKCDKYDSITVDGRSTALDDSRNIKKLWELGALTIKDVDFSKNTTTLKYTNQEMQTSFRYLVLKNFAEMNHDNFVEFGRAAAQGNFGTMAEALNRILKPKDRCLTSEWYVQHILYEGFKNADLGPKGEQPTTEGKKIDLRLENIANHEYVIELKFNRTVQEAVKQIKETKYCLDSLKNAKVSKKSVLALGLNYSTETGVSLIFLRAELGEVKGKGRNGKKGKKVVEEQKEPEVTYSLIGAYPLP